MALIPGGQAGPYPVLYKEIAAYTDLNEQVRNQKPSLWLGFFVWSQ